MPLDVSSVEFLEDINSHTVTASVRAAMIFILDNSNIADPNHAIPDDDAAPIKRIHA